MHHNLIKRSVIHLHPNPTNHFLPLENTLLNRPSNNIQTITTTTKNPFGANNVYNIRNNKNKNIRNLTNENRKNNKIKNLNNRNNKNNNNNNNNSPAIITNPALQITNKTTFIKIGLVLPMRGDFGFERTASASTMAIRDAKKLGLLEGVDVSVLYKDDKCDGKEGLGVTADLHFLDKVNVYVGFPCSAAAVDAAKLVSYWNIPWIAFASAEQTLGNVTLYNTLVRLFSPYDRLGMGLVRMLNYFKWQTIAMLYLEEGECFYSMTSVHEVFDGCDIVVSSFLKMQSKDAVADKIRQHLIGLAEKARIILLCGQRKFISSVLAIADELGYTNGDYVFILASQLPGEHVREIWKEYTDLDGKMMEPRVFEYVIQFSIDLLKAETKKAQDFLASVPIELAKPPWNYNGSLINNISGSKYSLYLYDSVFVYAILADTLMKENMDQIDNGTEYLERGRNFTLENKMTGNIVIDYKSDRIEDYAAWYLPHAKSKYTRLLKMPLTKVSTIPHSIDSCATDAQVVVLVNNTMKIFPADEPVCGFDNAKCASAARDVIIITCVVVVLLLLFFIIIFNSYRRKVYEREVLMMRWRVRRDDVLVFNRNKMSQTSLGKTLDPKDFTAKETEVLTGQYNGSGVAIKRLQSGGLVLAREDLLELKIMKDISHDHINNFVGLCLDHNFACILIAFCARGSLQDILNDDLIKLDENFKLSFVVEIIKGMDYLHKSQIKYHGRLKSTNILVDGRWIVKITDWGLIRFRNNKAENEEDTYAALLWTGPERLRTLLSDTLSVVGQECSPAQGQKGDVYSFAIILHEIIYRRGAFNKSTAMVKSKEIIKKVRDGLYPPYRPHTSTHTASSQEATNNEDNNLLAIIDECWEENPAKRPEFGYLKTKFSTLYKSRNLNLIDNMLKMMENYSNNLEMLVDERTTQLVEEKKKTDRLLYSLMPATVADRLKSGVKVDPESYACASVYFSDIVSFTTMAAESSPMEVVALLNSLYLMFDDIISTFNVYKVETIGDAYMVASGVPVPNDMHTREIALMSLAIRKGVAAFKIPHIPTRKLQVRIGNNCGPVVAGVVGHTMPRYCLFGDTVNTASRMESTGEAMKIQLSQSSRDMLVATGDEFVLVERGLTEIKGKGLQATYWLEGKK